MCDIVLFCLFIFLKNFQLLKNFKEIRFLSVKHFLFKI